MKTAIYIEDGLTQFVLTPETDIDKKVLKSMEQANLKTYRGNFYACAGGWTRQDPNHWEPAGRYLDSTSHNDESLIFVIDKNGAVQQKQIFPGVVLEGPCVHQPLGGPCSICLTEEQKPSSGTVGMSPGAQP